MRKLNIQHLLSGTNSEPEQIFGTWVVQGSNVGKNIMVYPIPSAHPTYSRCPKTLSYGLSKIWKVCIMSTLLFQRTRFSKDFTALNCLHKRKRLDLMR